MLLCILPCSVFFIPASATTEIYTLSLHDALPIFETRKVKRSGPRCPSKEILMGKRLYVGNLSYQVSSSELEQLFGQQDRKSTRLNSSHSQISYAVFCLKKKKQPTW